MIEASGVRAIVTDIEGTTSSIAFVHEVLFPFARARLDAYVARGGPEIADILDEVRAAEPGEPLATLHRWMDEDRKSTPLKAMQGLIWREGYVSGALKGHLYDDAAPTLRRWRERGIRLFVYSSGSEAAQRLLFGHSVAGDLTPLFEGYFDTRVGAKANAESYERITRAIDIEPSAVLFLSDAPAEITAARAAGMQAIRLVRDGQAAAGEAVSFDDISVS